MRTVQIGDIHGRKEWKEIVNKEEKADRIVFTGDYWDSFDVPFADQDVNFHDLMAFKKEQGIRVVMLLGNHDFHYCPWAQQVGERYSGFQHKYKHLIQHELQEAFEKSYIDIAHSIGDVLFTHAGVTKTWWEAVKDKLPIKPWNELAGQLNELFLADPMLFGFTGYDNSGDDVQASPTWVRPRSLSLDAVEHWRQVVGHTRVREIVNIQDRIWLTDVLENKKRQYLSITDGVIDINTY